MRHFLCMVFLSCLALRAEPIAALNFSDAELHRIEARYGSGAKDRIRDFREHLKRFRTYERERQIVEVNTYINGYLPEFDMVINRQEDRWSTPKEFLTLGYGDCEEYAITKYFTLLELGFSEKTLCLAVVRDLYSGGYHMVLAYFGDTEASPLVLDNLSFRVIPLSRRSDLQVQYCINEGGVFSVGSDGSRKKLPRKAPKFDDLIKRIDAGR